MSTPSVRHSDPPAPHLSGENTSGLEAFSAALASTQGLLARPEGRRRWRALALIAAMAGIVGAGAQPPPLGMLLPVWEEPLAREALLSDPVVVGSTLFLAVLLLGMSVVARSFTFAFLEGIVTRAPRAGRFRAYLRPGARHFWWSSGFSVPLYAVLFAAEGAITHRAYQELLRTPNLTNEQAWGMLFGAVGLFFVVLVPWMFLTLPAMVLLYELVPAAMLGGGAGPMRSCRRVLAAAGRCPGRFLGYLGVRTLMQVAGNMAAGVALLPCAAVTLLLCSPLLAGGWWLTGAVGGAATAPGAAVLSVVVLVTLVVLYCFLCWALVPISLLLNGMAFHFLAAHDPGLDAWLSLDAQAASKSKEPIR
ncbi:MAG: hypothetical protein ACK47B_17595 [Armatimonadota bacterium]